MPTIPVSMALCFVVGALIGFPALRVKGLYLALVTLGLAVVFPDLTNRFVNGTGGTNLVTLKGADVAVPDWFFWFPDPIAVPRQVGRRATTSGRTTSPSSSGCCCSSRCSSWRGAGSGAR